MAVYRALYDLTLPGDIYINAGDTFNAPASWIPPPGAVDPQDSQALADYFAAGPGTLQSAEPNMGKAPWLNGQRWTGQPVAPPVHYWTRVPGNPKQSQLGFQIWPSYYP